MKSPRLISRLQNRSNLAAATALLLVVAVSSCSPPPPPPKPKPKAKEYATAPAVTMNPFSAIASGNADALRYVLLHDTSIIRTQMPGGVTLLHYACAYPNTNIVEMLVMAGCEVNATDERGMTPLMTALLRRQNGLAQYLISRGADVTAPNSNGRTPLHTAIVSGVDRAVIEAILSRRADVNAVDHAGITPLHMAIQTEQAEIAALLVEKGANVEAKTRDGLTTMDLARRNARGDIMDLLSAKLKQIDDAKPKVAVVEPPVSNVPTAPQPVAPVKPATPASPAPMLKRIYLFLETANNGLSFSFINVKNTGMNTAKVTIKVKTLYEDDYIETKERTITLDPMERRELSPVLFGYRLLTTVTPGTGRVTPRGVIPPEELMPHGKTLGIVVEAWVDGQRDNIVANPLSMLQKIKRIERDAGP